MRQMDYDEENGEFKDSTADSKTLTFFLENELATWANFMEFMGFSVVLRTSFETENKKINKCIYVKLTSFGYSFKVRMFEFAVEGRL